MITLIALCLYKHSWLDDQQMLKEENYYIILDIKQSATQQEIKKQYRKMTKYYHPDQKNSPHSTDIFKKIAEAYEILNDKEKR